VAPVLVELLVSNRLSDLRMARDPLLGMGPVAFPALRDGLKAKEPEPVIVTLGLIGPDARAAVPDLIPFLGRTEEPLRAAAIETLGRIGPDSKPALPNLIAAFKDPKVSQLAIRAVSRIGKDAVTPLIEALKDPVVTIRAGSAEALGRIGPDAKRAVPHLLALRDNEHQDSAVRYAAREALKLLDPD
jgi:HEAT repeat protein